MKTKLKETHFEKDVGLIFSNDLRFKKHIDNVVSKANQIADIVRRCFECLDNAMFLKFYKSIIRPRVFQCHMAPYVQTQKTKVRIISKTGDLDSTSLEK